jgi:competence protein ComEC
MVKREILINSCILAFLNGISAVSWYFGFNLLALVLPLAWGFWWVEIFGAGSGGSGLKKIWFWTGVWFLFGVFWMGVVAESWNWEKIPGGAVMVQGVVAGVPVFKQDQLEIILDDLKLNGKDFPDRRLQVKISNLEKVKPADMLSFSAELIDSRDQTLPLVYRQFLLRQRVNWVARSSRGLKVNGGMRTEDFFVGIWLMRQWLNEQLSAAVKEPAASLLMGILIGERGNLPKDLTDNFQITGLTHILAISGFNITLIINLILLLLAGARKGWRWLASCLLIGFFVFLTGGSASVVRAAVMGVLALSVKTLGRKIGVLQLILMSTFLIVIMDPTILNFDLSFQLSLVATMSLVFFADFWELAVSKPWQVWVWEGISLTVAAQVLTLPLIFFGFGKISLISPISNLLIGPMIPVLMLLGVVLLGLIYLFPWLAIIFAGLTEILVLVMVSIIDFLAKLPLAQVEFGQGQWVVVLIYYLLVFKFFRKRKQGPG